MVEKEEKLEKAIEGFKMFLDLTLDELEDAIKSKEDNNIIYYQHMYLSRSGSYRAHFGKDVPREIEQRYDKLFKKERQGGKTK